MHFLHSGIAEVFIVQTQHAPIFVSTPLGTPTGIQTQSAQPQTMRDKIMADATYSTTATFDLRARALGLFDDVAARWAAYKVYATTKDELAKLSDRELADLGLYRADIARVAREAAYGA